VDVGTLGFGVQGQVFGVEFHVPTFTTRRGGMAANLARIWARTDTAKHGK
jgi:hypothetical protein